MSPLRSMLCLHLLYYLARWLFDGRHPHLVEHGAGGLFRCCRHLCRALHRRACDLLLYYMRTDDVSGSREGLLHRHLAQLSLPEAAAAAAAAATAAALAPNPSLGSPATRCTSTALASPSPTQAAAASARRRSPSSSAWRPSRESCCNCWPRTSTCRPAHSSRRSTRRTWQPLRFPRARSPPLCCASATTAAARSHRPRRLLRQRRARSPPPLLPLRVAGRRAGRRVWRFAGDCIPLYS